MRRSNLNIAGRLIGLVKPLLPVMIIAILMGVAGFLCATFITVFGAYAILNTLQIATPFTTSFLFVAVLVFALLRGILRYSEQASNHYIAFKLLALLRDKVFQSLSKLAPAKLEGRDKGNLITVITTDIELLEVFYAHTISPIAIAILTCLFMVFFIGSYHWLLGVVSLVAYMTVGLLIPIYATKKGRIVGDNYRNQVGALSSFFLDSLRGVKEVLQFGQGKNKLEEIEKQTKELGHKQEELKKIEGHISAVTNTAILLFSLTMLFLSIHLKSIGATDFAGVLVSTVAMLSSFGPVVALANLANNLFHTFAAGNRVLDILDEEPMTEEIINKKDVVFEGVSCENVTFGYKDEVVLDDISLKIPKGEIVGINGKSGSGKSTLLKLMMRFWETNKGEVKMSRENVNNINTSSLRQNQSLVTQETILFHDTIENNVKIAKLSATREEVITACKKASIHDFILSLPQGYDTNVGELGETLSGGERQRLGVARAFLHNAPLMLLDEPTSNLDALNEGIILKALKEQSQNNTVVLVSHRKSTMAIADRVYNVENGKRS